ncbi:MAG: RodZ domain-containing protein [Rhizomicrobium sp.]|jgi:cytoskeleton protein RodZ
MSKVTHLTSDEHGGLNRRRIHLREISGDADAPLDTVGQDLRAARLRRGDDLAAVSRSLKIRKDHLEAIEEDRLEALPGRTYAVGFVRSYAEYLGLDSVQAVERFKGEIAGRGDGGHQIALAPETDERRLPHGWVIIAIVVLAVLAYGAYHLAKSADNLLRQPVAAVPARIVPPHPAPANLGGKYAAQPPRSATTANASAGPPVAGAGGQASPQILAGQNPSAGPKLVSPNTSSSAPANAVGTQALAGQAPPAPAVSAPAGQEFGQQNQDARVILRASAPTRILVQAGDGAVFINRVLHPGDSYRVPDKVGLMLTTPDGGAVSVELDGQVMGAAGKQGQMTEALSLDPQALADRYGGGNPR